MLSWVEHEKRFITSGPGVIFFKSEIKVTHAYVHIINRRVGGMNT